MNFQRDGRFFIPLIFTVTGLLAIGFVGMTGGQLILPIVLSVLFIAPYFVRLRLPDSNAVVWVVRAVVYVVIVTLTRSIDEASNDISDPHTVIIMGFIASAEMVLQCWRKRPAGSPPGLSLVLFAGIAYLGGCYTSDPAESVFVKWFTPAFFLLLAMSWRRIEAGTLHDPLSRWAKSVYVFTLVSAIGIGFVIYLTLTNNRDEINQYAQSLISGRPAMSEPGMSDSPQLGSTFGLQNSTDRVLLIKGALSDPHLRAVAFEDYKNGMWGPPVTARVFTAAPSYLGAMPDGEALVQVDKFRYASGLIYYPLDANFVGLDHQSHPMWSQAESGPIRTESLGSSVYTFTESGNSSDRLEGPTLPGIVAEDLDVPSSIVPAVRRLAQEIIRGKTTPYAKIQAICARLDSDHGYSLSYQTGPGDPISGFILSKKSAHCEYFASAAVMLMRCAHIPSRYVIGYYAHEQDENGATIVRQRDAHAWAEAYVDGTWTTVDATPAGGRPDELFGEVSVWQRYFEAVEDRIQFLQDQAQEIGPIKIATVVGGLVCLYFFIRVLLKEINNRKPRQTTDYDRNAGLSIYAERFERLLQKRNINVPAGETWLEFFEREQDLPIDKDTVSLFIEEYYELRFGSGQSEGLSELLNKMERDDSVKETV